MKTLFRANWDSLKWWILGSFAVVLIGGASFAYTVYDRGEVERSEIVFVCLMLGLFCAIALPASQIQENIDGFGAFILTLPVSRKKVISQKYLSSLILLAVDLIFGSAFLVWVKLTYSGGFSYNILNYLLGIAGIYLFTFGIIMPVSLYIKSQMGMGIMCGFIGGICGFLIGFLEGYFENLPSDFYYGLIIFAIGFIIFSVSYIISHYLYSKKEL